MVGLREQLLKAGLVNKKQVKQADAAERKLKHDVIRNKEAAVKDMAAQEQALADIEAEKERKRLEDKERNLAIEAERREHEKIYRARQLLKSNDLTEPRADSKYFFPENGRFVRCVLVTSFQREMLARGKLGIARLDGDEQEFAIVPAHTIQTLRQLTPERFLLLHSAIDDSLELDSIVMKESLDNHDPAA